MVTIKHSKSGGHATKQLLTAKKKSLENKEPQVTAF